MKLLVEKISVDRTKDGRAKVDITYRLGPPSEESASIVVGVKNPWNSLREGPRREESAGTVDVDPKMSPTT
jgi:hypothetical protein